MNERKERVLFEMKTLMSAETVTNISLRSRDRKTFQGRQKMFISSISLRKPCLMLQTDDEDGKCISKRARKKERGNKDRK
jgi:hypothetical protein